VRVVPISATRPTSCGRYVTPEGLRNFLIDRVEDGFVFPLNPKWILCDKGWYEVFETMEAAPSAQQALDAWFPPYSGLRQLLREVHDETPGGFERLEGGGGAEEDISAARALLALKRFQTFRRARLKLRIVLFWMAIGRQARERRLAAEARAHEEAPLTKFWDWLTDRDQRQEGEAR
jgi:hypothetical protein